jgi:hypothetical protein
MTGDQHPDLNGQVNGDEEPSSELTRRLADLRWPEVSEEVRERCWRELSHQLSEATEPKPGMARPVDLHARAAYGRARQRRFWGRDNPDGPGGRRFGRHDFSPHTGESLYPGALSQRVVAARATARWRLR